MSEALPGATPAVREAVRVGRQEKPKQTAVLLIGPLPPPLHGQSLAFEALCQYLSRRLCDVRVIPHPRLGSKCEATFARVAEFAAMLINYVCSIICARKPVVVYSILGQSSRGSLRDFVVTLVAKLAGARTVSHLHSGSYGIFYEDAPTIVKMLIRRVLRQSDTIVVLSPGLKQMLRFLPEVLSRVAVVTNAAFGADYTGHMSKKVIERSGPLRILFLSNMIESKGYMYVLEAARILNEGYRVRTAVDFAGTFIIDDSRTGENRDARVAERRFQEAIADKRAQAYVRYHGAVNGDKKYQLLRECHFFVLPTQYLHEGLPISLLEAMLFGCVPIVSRYRAIPDAVKNGYNGLLIESVSADSIARLIYSCYVEPEMFCRLSERARGTVMEGFRPEAHLSAMEGVIIGKE